MPTENVRNASAAAGATTTGPTRAAMLMMTLGLVEPCWQSLKHKANKCYFPTHSLSQSVCVLGVCEATFVKPHRHLFTHTHTNWNNKQHTSGQTHSCNPTWDKVHRLHSQAKRCRTRLWHYGTHSPIQWEHSLFPQFSFPSSSTRVHLWASTEIFWFGMLYIGLRFHHGAVTDAWHRHADDDEPRPPPPPLEQPTESLSPLVIELNCPINGDNVQKGTHKIFQVSKRFFHSKSVKFEREGKLKLASKVNICMLHHGELAWIDVGCSKIVQDSRDLIANNTHRNPNGVHILN